MIKPDYLFMLQANINHFFLFSLLLLSLIMTSHFISRYSRSSHPDVFCKMVVLTIPPNSHESKFREFCEIFKTIFFNRAPPVASSVTRSYFCNQI